MTIRPTDIDTSKHFFSAFGNSESEVSANWLVSFCQQREGGPSWRPFSLDELTEFYQAGRVRAINRKRAEKGLDPITSTDETFHFNKLYDHRYPHCSVVYVDDEGMVHITQDFVVKCYLSSPAVECEGVSPKIPYEGN